MSVEPNDTPQSVKIKLGVHYLWKYTYIWMSSQQWFEGCWYKLLLLFFIIIIIIIIESKSIYSDAGAAYDYTTNQMYIMDLTVNDGTANSNTGYALLYITKNDPPKITNLGRK